jgi:hypothetical protein
MLDLKKLFILSAIFGLAAPGMSQAATGAADAEPWWFPSLELVGLFMVIFLVVKFFAKLPDKNLPARRGIRRLFISNIIGFSILGTALVIRSYSETQGVSEFNGDLAFELMVYLSLPFFISGIIGYHDEDSGSL